MPTPTEITGVDFATVFVTDYPAAVEFYGQTLGLEQSADYGKIPGGEFETGSLTLQVLDSAAIGREFQPSTHLEAKDVNFLADTMDSGVCHMVPFADPDGNVLMLHHRYAPRD